MIMSHPPRAHSNSLKTLFVPKVLVLMTNSSLMLTTQVFGKFSNLTTMTNSKYMVSISKTYNTIKGGGGGGFSPDFC